MSTKNKVLMVCANLNNSGTPNATINIAKSLSKKYTFDFLSLKNDDHYFDKDIESLGGRVINLSHLNKKGILTQRTFWKIKENKIKKIMQENGPYLAVHCNFDIEAGFVLRAAYKAKIPTRICHIHRITDTTFSNSIFKPVLKQYGKLRERYVTDRIACSKRAGKSLWETAPFTLVYSPYDEEKYFYKELTETEAPRLIQVASYSDNKNQLFTIEVFNRVKSIYPKAKLTFIGFENQPGYFGKMKNKVAEYGIDDSVEFLPQDSDVAEKLNVSTIMLFPSLKEGFGMVPVEAQASGVYCLASTNITEETNCGGCEYINLDKGPEFWASRVCEIHNKTKGKHHYYDCKKLSFEEATKRLSKIYEGKS